MEVRGGSEDAQKRTTRTLQALSESRMIV